MPANNIRASGGDTIAALTHPRYKRGRVGARCLHRQEKTKGRPFERPL